MQNLILTSISEEQIKKIVFEAFKQYSDMIKVPEKEDTNKPEEIHSIEELAEYLNVSKSTAQKVKNEGAPHIQISERKFKMNPDELDSWLKKRNRQKIYGKGMYETRKF